MSPDRTELETLVADPPAVADWVGPVRRRIRARRQARILASSLAGVLVLAGAAGAFALLAPDRADTLTTAESPPASSCSDAPPPLPVPATGEPLRVVTTQSCRTAWPGEQIAVRYRVEGTGDDLRLQSVNVDHDRSSGVEVIPSCAPAGAPLPAEGVRYYQFAAAGRHTVRLAGASGCAPSPPMADATVVVDVAGGCADSAVPAVPTAGRPDTNDVRVSLTTGCAAPSVGDRVPLTVHVASNAGPAPQLSGTLAELPDEVQFFPCPLPQPPPARASWRGDFALAAVADGTGPLVLEVTADSGCGRRPGRGTATYVINVDSASLGCAQVASACPTGAALPAGGPACDVSKLRIDRAKEGAAAGFHGYVLTVTNLTEPCVLRNDVTVTGRSDDGRSTPFPVQVVAAQPLAVAVGQQATIALQLHAATCPRTPLREYRDVSVDFRGSRPLVAPGLSLWDCTVVVAHPWQLGETPAM